MIVYLVTQLCLENISLIKEYVLVCKDTLKLEQLYVLKVVITVVKLALVHPNMIVLYVLTKIQLLENQIKITNNVFVLMVIGIYKMMWYVKLVM